MSLRVAPPGLAPAVAIVLCVACQLPPDSQRQAADAAAAADGPPVGPHDGGQCWTPIPPDRRAAERAACAFGTGAKAIDTLPLTDSERAEIPIKHVIVLMKENRSFDHLLGNLNASGQTGTEAIPASFTNTDRAGVKVSPFHLGTTCVNLDPGHQWDEMHRQVNGGAMDGFVTNGADTTGGDGHFVMGNYLPGDLPFYYWLANTFAINDRHFAAARSGTWPDRNFLLLGTADGIKCTYCGLPKSTTPSIFDEMDAAGVTWGVYTDGNPFDGTLGWTEPHAGLYDFAAFERALQFGLLPSVAFVDSLGWIEDEHPTADLQVGEAWTRIVYQAAAASPLWPEMAIIWTYDEGGGFADHVPPPSSACIARPGNPLDAPFFELGVRVPLAVISPYARPHYVSHVVEDHTAITRFIETVFGLPALTSRDANSSALLDMFDFGCAPALLAPPEAPVAGKGGCHGDVVLVTDKPSYPSTDSLAIRIDFSGVPAPSAHDRIGVYKYSTVPTEASQLEPIAWAYAGGQGHMPEGAPASGSVVLDGSVLSPGAAWPLSPGLWIVYYLPALPSGADGHTPAAAADLEVTP